MLTALLVGLGVAAGLPLSALPEMLLPLAFAATLTAFIFSLFLYLKALVAPASALAPGGNSGERSPSWVRIEADGGTGLHLHPPLFSRQSHLRLFPGTGTQPTHLFLRLQIFLRTAAWPHRLGMLGMAKWASNQGEGWDGRAGQGQNCADMSLIIPQIFVESIMCSKHCSRYWETKEKHSYREEKEKMSVFMKPTF